MSKQIQSKRLTIPEIVGRKGGEKIVCLTAYTTPVAALLDPHVDLLLVGDSVGMVLHGLPNTIGVTLEMMILHGKAVMRGASHAVVVVDLPFGTYEQSPEMAHNSAVRLMCETGCQAVKVESGKGIANTIAFLVDRGIPVVGHIGLRPQATNVEGGFKAKGRTAAEREQIIADAVAADEAGAFAIVVEGVATELANEITRLVKIPTIGIGASPQCDGQILVTDDMLGLFDWTPKFVRRYGNMRETISSAVAAYASDVRSGQFPGQAELYTLGIKVASA